MKRKLLYAGISLFIAFWIAFIAWGMLKTTAKLTKGKTPAAQTQPKGTAPAKETPPKKDEPAKPAKAETPAPAAPAPTDGGAQAPEMRMVLVRVSPVKATDFEDILPVMGTIKGKTETELRFETAGVIRKINFQEGQKIKKGDIIACIDPKEGQLKYEYAKSKYVATEAGYRSAQKKLEVQQNLYSAGAIIKARLEEIQLEVESAKAQVETARAEMELAANEVTKTCIVSPREGVMGPREAEEGEFVTPQDKIGSLLEISQVLVEVGIVERDINKVKIGQIAKVYVDANPTMTFEGTVDKIYPIVEGKSRTLTAKIKVSNPQGLLMPGMFSRAEILVVQLKDALMIPSVALIQAGGGVTLVPLIPAETLQKAEDETQTGIVELRRVTLGYLAADYAQATLGLNVGDLVVIEAQGELKDKMPVKIVGVEEPGL